jgi:Phosphatidate phosphatase APP1, catalytic domain
MTSLLEVMTRRAKPLTTLRSEDRVVLFPSLGHLSQGGEHWIVNVHGDVSATGRLTLGKRVLLKLLQRSMRASNEAFACELFRERIARFVAFDRPGRRIAVRVGERLVPLPKKTRHNGHFQAAVLVPIGLAQELTGGDAETGSLLPLDVCQSDQTVATSGQVHLLGRTGVSIISDIDDTLKHSYVACKRTLLTNTFLRPFETIPGMAGLFRDWSATGAAFHYVSSSPWQLYQHLADHLAVEGFPTGSFHLRAFRLRDHLIRRLLMLRRSGKLGVIRSLVKLFPQRQFILVGDSGEHDPEVYGAVARRYRNQVSGVFIRQLGGPRDSQRRYSRALRGVDPALVRLYRDAEELTDVRLPNS